MRQAFSTWIRKQSENATPETLVRALGEHEWNAEADKIAKHYNISREKGRQELFSMQVQFTTIYCFVFQVETDDDEVELNIGVCFWLCE